MPIILRHNDELEVSRVEYFGAVRAEDMHNHAAFNADNPVWLGFDCISVIHADLDVASFSLADLDGVFKAHRDLFEPLNLLFMRRSGWVCESAAGQRLLDHWLGRRNAHGSPWAEVRQFDTFAGASDWLMLNPDDSSALASGEGFREIARFKAAPKPAR
ncbi:hypothetical protein [Vitreimonas sp.]|uniref:hypothetical protein n=1 Tax=Vitreimonas sp. TaxID=3069702 RepID=UPI002ED8FDEB